MRVPSVSTVPGLGSPSLVSWAMDSTTGTAGGRPDQATRAAMRAAAMAAPAIHAQLACDFDAVIAVPGALPESDNASNANARSDADWNRCAGFFSRQRCTTRGSAEGMAGTICEMAG